jgi:hypothetical protein
MTSILHLAGYAISRRAQMIATKRRLERVKARNFLVVTHNEVLDSKAIIIHCETLTDDHTVLGAFHQLKVAKAYQSLHNGYINYNKMFGNDHAMSIHRLGM